MNEKAVTSIACSRCRTPLLIFPWRMRAEAEEMPTSILTVLVADSSGRFTCPACETAATLK